METEVKLINKWPRGNGMVVTHYYRSDAERTLCGKQIENPHNYHIMDWGRGWTFANEKPDFNEDCKSCMKSDYSPCEDGRGELNHKMARTTANGNVFICPKCGLVEKR